MKALTRNQLESRKEKAVRFTRDVLGDSDRAEEIADESLEDYAGQRNIQIVENPHGGTMSKVRLLNPPRASNPRPSPVRENSSSGRTELLSRIRELEKENDELQDKLDKVAELAEPMDCGCEEEFDDLVDRLNDIIDVVAPGDEGKDEDHEGND